MAAEDVSAAAAVGTLLVTGGALAFAWYQIREGRRNTQRQLDDALGRERRARVDQYLARLTATDFRPAVADAVDLFAVAPAERERAWRAWNARSTDEKLKTLAFLNFFEEVAGQYQDGLLDREAARHVIAPTAVRYWEAGDWFIARLKERQPSAFSQWEAMVREIRLSTLMRGYTR